MVDDGWLTTLGVGGRIWSRSEPFLFGAIAVDVAQPFDVERAALGRSIVQEFAFAGGLDVSVVQPFVLIGPAFGEVVELWHLLSGADGVYDEGGIARPIVGWYEAE